MTKNVHPLHFTRPVAGALIVVGAIASIAVGAMAYGTDVGVDHQVATPTVPQAAYDPFDFTATVSALDVVIPDFMAVYEPGRATGYEVYINDIAAS